MNRNLYAQMTLCIVLVFAVSAACFGQVYAPQPFSADFSATTQNGTKMIGKYYFALPSFRLDMNAQGRNISSISNGSTQTTYMVMHDQHMYMEMPANQANPFMRQGPAVPHNFDPNNPCAWAPNAGTCKKVGTEMVNGRLCDKYQGTSKDGKETGTGWIDQRLHFPIKYVDSNGGTVEFSNIKEGKPDASLFQPPTGYRKMNIPAGMMGGGRPPQ